jgi:DNA-directed RNA polymerase sigma subunit (sigma70/sigma32)
MPPGDTPGDHRAIADLAAPSASRFTWETINKVMRLSVKLLQELGHDPTPEVIATN